MTAPPEAPVCRSVEAAPGTYALVLRCRSTAVCEVGAWGRLELEAGYYIYVGSAFGRGGVRARVARHFRGTKAKRWHIDYLRPFVLPVGAWYTHDRERREHRWAGLVSTLGGVSSFRGFGSSDCDCFSHLFHFALRPGYAVLPGRFGGHVRFCDAQAAPLSAP